MTGRLVPAEEARMLLEEATPRPWRWENTQDVLLRGNSQPVMTFARSGMNGAQPVMLREKDGVYEKTARANLNEFPDARLIAAAPDLAFTVEQQGKRIAAALALHRQGWHDFITGVDCNREECGHEDGCPTERLAICSGCDRQHSEVDDYYLERTGGYEAVKWPCPTARALGVES